METSKVVWVLGHRVRPFERWRPKGFERFFEDLGVPATEPQAPDRSVADAVVRKVVQNVEAYGMHLADGG